MDTKLTLKLNNGIVNRAKEYAKEQGTSLSRMVEAYFDSLTKKDKKKPKISPLVKSLSGVIKLPEDYDYKKDYAEYLAKKYK